MQIRNWLQRLTNWLGWTKSPQPPAPRKMQTRAEMRERHDVSPWHKSWNGNGTVEPFTPEEWKRILARGAILHDHPYSRPATLKPCPECHFPDMAWGGHDHYKACSRWTGSEKARAAATVEKTPHDKI